MAKGNVAKSVVANTLAAAFGKNFLGEYDKKYYVQAMEDGQMVQIAIALTCPKVPVPFEGPVDEGDCGCAPEAVSTQTTPVQRERKEISEEEKQNLANLIEQLGL